MEGVLLSEIQEKYTAEQPLFRELADTVEGKLRGISKDLEIPCYTESRAKEVRSLVSKLTKKPRRAGATPRTYGDIVDKAGARVAVLYPWDLDKMEGAIRDHFIQVDYDDKRKYTEPSKFEYRATHIQVALRDAPEHLKGLECEIQVLTAAESLWAKAEHDLVYKSSFFVSDDTRRIFARLMSLAEIFDSELGRAYEMMSTLPRQPEHELLDVLTAHRSGFISGAYNKELSEDILRFFMEEFVRDEVEEAKRELEGFIREREQFFRGLFNRHKDDTRANPLIWQPELFIICLYLRKNKHILQDRWSESFSIDLLSSLAEASGSPLYMA